MWNYYDFLAVCIMAHTTCCHSLLISMQGNVHEGLYSSSIYSLPNYCDKLVLMGIFYSGEMLPEIC